MALIPFVLALLFAHRLVQLRLQIRTASVRRVPSSIGARPQLGCPSHPTIAFFIAVIAVIIGIAVIAFRVTPPNSFNSFNPRLVQIGHKIFQRQLSHGSPG